MSSEETLKRLALETLEQDADRIVQLIRVQMDNLTMPQCPVYEEVLDTQMFGLSKEIHFAVRLGLIDREHGRSILADLEKQVSDVHEAYYEHREQLKKTNK
ncbi:YlaN family protein [Nosocomiicoccus ampullae]|uniref:YlaN family protein n=1 Tax=Nosocomiicoccus ampullae TaxID=489910 RepID=UPI00254B0BCA|nr:YlaN family protein [Nosocomiicoccus ampullae]MDK6863400.1 YlaN family protein [Nosocomiicoccus ampullae]